MKWFLCVLALCLAAPVSAQPSLLSTLKALRAEYPTPMSKEQTGELLTRTARSAPGWALLRKPAGNNCPAMGVKVSCDYLVNVATATGYDVLVDSEGRAEPRWNRGTPGAISAGNMVAVGAVAPPVPDPGTDVPNPGTPPAVVDLQPVLERLAIADEKLSSLMVELEAARAQLVELRQQQVADRAEVVAWLKAQQATTDGSGRAWWQILLGIGR